MNYLFWLFVLFIPSQLGKHFWPAWSLVNGVRVDYLAPTIYMTDIVLLSFVLFSLPQHLSNFRFQISDFRFQNIYKVLILIFYILYLIFSSSRPWLAAYWLLIYLEIPLVAWVVKNQKSVPHRQVAEEATKIKSQIFLGLSIGIVFSVILGATQMILGKTTGLFWWIGERNFSVGTPGVSTIGIFGQQILRPYATFPHPNALAGWLAVGGLTIAIINRYKSLFSIKSRLAEIVAFAGVIMTASRIAIFSLSIGWLAFFSIGKIPSAAGAMIVFPHESIPERLILGRAAWQMFLKHPIFGVGPGQFLVNLPNFLPSGTWIIQPVHNVFLLLLAEFGIIGTLIGPICLISLIRQIGGWRQLMKWLPVLAILAITGLGDHYWLTAQQNRLLLGIVFGLIFLRRND